MVGLEKTTKTQVGWQGGWLLKVRVESASRVTKRKICSKNDKNKREDILASTTNNSKSCN